VATFRNYEPRSEGLNAAYDLLLRAELAKAQAMGGAFAPLTDAIRSGQQMKIARDEQARLTNAQNAETDYRNKAMALDTRALDLKEKAFATEQEGNQAYDAYMRTLLSGAAPSQPAASGVPFQGGGSAAMTQRSPLSAGGLLGGQPQGMPVPPPGMFTPELWSNITSAWNTVEDNQRAAQKYADEQRQKQQVEQAFNSNLAAGVAGKVKGVYEDKGAGIRARFAVDPKAASEELAKAQDAHLDRVGMQRKVKNDVKELRAAILQTDAESELKNRLLDGLELQVKSLEDIDPEIIKKNLEDARSYVYGTDTQSRSQRSAAASKPPPGIDLPGIGQNLTLNTSLDRRKDGGAAYSVKDGQVVGLSDAEAGELNRLVDTATSRDRLFDDSLMMVIAGDKLPPEYQKNLDAAREVQRAKVRKDILDQLGWQEVDARWAGAEGGQPQSVAGGPSDDPGQNIANDMLKAVAEGKVANDPAAMQKYLEENFTPTALRKVLGRSEAAANAAREDKIRKALAEGPGHKPPVKKLPSVGDAPPSWGKDQ